MAEHIIDISRISEVVNIGVRRASIFMGFGINAALSAELNNYQLDNITSLQFVEANADNDTIKKYKDEFASWITMNGFNELIEVFSIFLDKIYWECIIVYNSYNANKMPIKSYKDYTLKGIERKIEKLEEILSAHFKYKDCILSINKVRNCLTHRRGIVSYQDCINQKLTLKWVAVQLYTKKEDGTNINIDMPLHEPVLLNKGQPLMVKMADRIAEFKMGETVRISPKTLAEICFFIMILRDEVVKTTFDYFKSVGLVP